MIEKCLQMALLAPTSSNLQTWEFIRVVDSQKKEKLAAYCLNQPAATTAAELIVAVAHTHNWWAHSQAIADHMAQSEYSWPKTMQAYYEKLTRIAYGIGPLGLLGPIKAAFVGTTGFFRPIPRVPASKKERELWSVKTTALACENLMLAFSAAGFDTCPMEGMDEVRVRKLLAIPRSSRIVMVIGAGRRAKGGVYGPRLRLDSKQFLRTV